MQRFSYDCWGLCFYLGTWTLHPVCKLPGPQGEPIDPLCHFSTLKMTAFNVITGHSYLISSDPNSSSQTLFLFGFVYRICRKLSNIGFLFSQGDPQWVHCGKARFSTQCTRKALQAAHNTLLHSPSWWKFCSQRSNSRRGYNPLAQKKLSIDTYPTTALHTLSWHLFVSMISR